MEEKGLRKRMLLASFVGFIMWQGVQGLKDVRIYVPSAVVRGQNAILQCHYDLEGDLLYAVKWYKGRREFYRYTPRESPAIKQFPIPGLKVKEEASNDTHVVLENVSRDNRGPFSCEISADAPSFFTGIETGVLEVVDLPKKDPFITGLKTRYRLGDTLKANCTSGESRPAANLSWYVNGKPAEPQQIHKHRHQSISGETAHSILRLHITKQLFTKGRLKIRCVASMHDVYYRSVEKTVELEKKRYRTYIPETELATLFPTTTTTYRPPDIVWQSAVLPPERYPDATLIFTSPINSNGNETFRGRKLLLCNVALFLHVLIATAMTSSDFLR